MKKHLSCLAMIACALFFYTPTAHADLGSFGIGLVGEDPNGLTAKFRLNTSNALDFRVGLNFNNTFEVQGNYLISPFLITSTGDLDLPFYVGLGGEVFFVNVNGNSAAVVLARVPVGAALELKSIPIDIFLEVAPKLAVIPVIDVVLDAAVGIRFWF